MSSVIDLASLFISDDPAAKARPLLALIVNVSDIPRDPLKAANRETLLKHLAANTPEFESWCEDFLGKTESSGEDTDDLLSDGAAH